MGEHSSHFHLLADRPILETVGLTIELSCLLPEERQCLEQI